MKKYRCREKGCDHAPFSTPQGEALHHGKVHTKTIMTRRYRHAQSQAVVSFAGENGGATPVVLDAPPVKADWRSQAAAKGARGYWAGMTPKQRSAEIKRRMTKGRAVKGKTVQEIQINYCPNCGCHIHGVAVGMALAAHVKG